MTPSTTEENKSHLDKTNCFIRGEEFNDDNDFNQHKV